MSQSLFKDKVLLVHRHAHSFTYCLSMAAFIFTTADLVVLAETVWLAKQNICSLVLQKLYAGPCESVFMCDRQCDTVRPVCLPRCHKTAPFSTHNKLQTWKNSNMSYVAPGCNYKLRKWLLWNIEKRMAGESNYASAISTLSNGVMLFSRCWYSGH